MESHDQVHNIRHSAAHVLAQAVVELFPGTLPTIGPVTETGFFYDFLPVKNFKEEDLERIEAKMREIVKRNERILGKEVSKDEARALFKDNRFKLELIDQIPDEKVGVFSQGSFCDLCKGGHVESTGQVKHFKILAISGSYWRADRDGVALQRIAGIAFATKEELDAHLKHLEEVQMYDHRRLGKQLDLFSFNEVAPGMPFIHPKGVAVYNKMIEYMRHVQAGDFMEIRTPQIMDECLWKTSGHANFYREHMYTTQAENVPCCIKPMNCPGSILFYKERPHSYRELPYRISEFGFLHRFELSGVLHGLMRVRAFTMDDAHVYCTNEQMEKEIEKMLEIAKTVYNKYEFKNIKWAVSTRPEKYIGTPALWDQATEGLKRALERRGFDYVIQEGEGAFYGPKIEIKILDAMGREWQCGTVQVDFFQPMNFGLEYIDSDQSRKTPVMLHVAIYGSIERFLGIILEHFKGHLPFWLAPVQIRVMTITNQQDEYAQNVLHALRGQNLRVERDLSGDQISAQIRRAQVEKVPWMIVIGQKEVDQNTVTLRHPDGKQEFGLSLESVMARAAELNKF